MINTEFINNFINDNVFDNKNEIGIEYFQKCLSFISEKNYFYEKIINAYEI